MCAECGEIYESGKCTMEEVFNLIQSGTCPRSMLEFLPQGGDIKLGRSPGWNLTRAERSRLCIYTFIEGQRKNEEINDRIDPIASIHNDSSLVSSIATVKRVND